MDMMPPVATTLESMRTAVRRWHQEGRRVALVPTMGALHQGHLSLVQLAQKHADVVVVSIFVNPTQFGPNEDFDAYPRQLDTDRKALAQVGAAMVYAPEVGTMYPLGFATSVRVTGLTEGLCGASRPGHFEGVATIVTKLFTQVTPDVAVFGEKDFQQLAIIRRLVIDLNLPVTVVGAPTARDADGLALSSRNIYLSADERRRASAFPTALQACVAALEAGAPASRALAQTGEALSAGGIDRIDYIALCDATSLKPLEMLGDQPARLLAAVFLGRTRLIDNWPVKGASGQSQDAQT